MANNTNNQRPVHQQQVQQQAVPHQQGNLQALAQATNPQRIVAPAANPQHIIAPAANPQHIAALATDPSITQYNQFDLIQGNEFLLNFTHTSDAPDFTEFLFKGDKQFA
ncbi:1727_t:CDS:1 [Acaulospora morrowiae]|uniref:1727_t:CDS:1 n=1 Tax=Acaulospora morrowiae TaxID=94023 RepID=A0A9N8Z7H6_9GLOM|nr:1727_t:CDS:1 [Acaulospora morrowiae]